MSKFNMKNEYLSLNELDKLQNNYNKDDKNVILRHALSKTSIPDVIYVSESEHDLENKFSIDLKTMNVCNQKQSGRCWIFAGLNILREIIGKKLNVEQFELSQNYVAFFDKLEKINFTLSSVMELLDKEHDDRTLMHILTNGVGDGGQWDMFANLVKKYGVCPKNAMVETYQSSGTRESDVLINSMIRKFAADASKLYKEEKYDQIKEMKDELIQKSYNLLANCFGVPPKTFNLEYVDIFYHHRMDPETPLEETIEALTRIVKSGKALYAGLSNYDGANLEKASKLLYLANVPFIINQNRYSIFDRTIENNGLKLKSKKLGKGIIAYSPLAQGLLTDKYLNGIPDDSRIAADGRYLKRDVITRKKLEQIKALNDLALKRGESLAQMALRWVLKDEEITSVLIGASKPSQIIENLKIINKMNLTDEEIRIIDDITL